MARASASAGYRGSPGGGTGGAPAAPQATLQLTRQRGATRPWAARRALRVLAAAAAFALAARDAPRAAATHSATLPPHGYWRDWLPASCPGQLRAAGGRRMVVADAAASKADEEMLAELRAESQITGIIPIMWQFGSLVGNSVKQSVQSALGGRSAEVRHARRLEEERVRASAKAEELEREMQRACVKGHARAIARLVHEGAQVNLRNCRDWQRWAPLHYAVAHGRVAATDKLLELGAEVNMQDWDQWTPLHWAAYLGEVSPFFHVGEGRKCVTTGLH
jgi:hypothetical protein